jgi:hypothetical protein
MKPRPTAAANTREPPAGLAEDSALGNAPVNRARQDNSLSLRYTASRMRVRVDTSELELLLPPSVSMALSQRSSVAAPLSVSAQTRWRQRSHTNTSLPASPESKGSKRYIHR